MIASPWKNLIDNNIIFWLIRRCFIPLLIVIEFKFIRKKSFSKIVKNHEIYKG